MARLVVLSEGLSGRSHELKVERTTVGRVSDNNFEVPDQSVSSHHCEILLKGNDVVVKDLNSTNGTFINSERVTEAVLKPGQVLRLGQIELRLENAGAASQPRKPLDQTRVMPQGIKTDELDSGVRAVTFDKNAPFHKKTNQGTRIFVIGVVVLGVCILGALFYVLSKLSF